MKYFYFTFGFVLSMIAVTAINEVYAQSEIKKEIKFYDNLIEEQELSFKKTGKYFSVNEPLYKVHTYETLCSGFVEEIIYDNKIEYIGHGEKSSDYTHTVFTTGTSSTGTIN